MIIADKSFFDIVLRHDNGLELMDSITTSLGPIMSTNTIVVRVERKAERLRPPLNGIWIRKLGNIRNCYYNLLATKSSINDALEQIGNIAENISSSISSFSPKIDRMEIDVLATATWLRRKLSLEPIVVSDDRDVLRACHLFSSFFGLVTSVLSSFELCRLASEESGVREVCQHFSMTPPTCCYDGGFTVSGDLVREVNNVARSGFLSIHPSLPIARTNSMAEMTLKRRR